MNELSPRLELVRQYIIQASRKETPVFYRKIADLLDIESDRLDHSAELANSLDQISSYEFEHGRPLLSVNVVHQDDQRPGNGFYVMAKRNKVQKPGEDNETFFALELRKLYDFWKNQP